MRYEQGTGRLRRRKKNDRYVGGYFFKFGGTRISTGTDDRRQAERFRRKFLGDVEKGIRAAKQSTATVNDLLDRVVDDYRRRHLRSLAALTSRLKHLRPALGAWAAYTVTESDIEVYEESRDDEGATVATVNRELEVVRRAYRLAVRKRVLRPFEVPFISLRTEDNTRTGFLEPEDYPQLRDAFDDDAVRLMFIIGYHVGWRAGRIKTLTWPQVDFKNRVIHPPSDQAHNKSVGAAPIYGDLEKALQAERMIHERDWPDCQWVIHRTGKPVVDYRDAWDRAVQLAEFEGLHFHDLRRSAVRNMLDAGMDESKVMRIVGHKTRAMIDRYRIVSVKDVAKAGEQMARYLEERRGDRRSETLQ